MCANWMVMSVHSYSGDSAISPSPFPAVDQSWHGGDAVNTLNSGTLSQLMLVASMIIFVCGLLYCSRALKSWLFSHIATP